MKQILFPISRLAACICLAACLMVSGGMSLAYANGESYFSAFPELPVPAQMTENADSAVRFDQPDGRIITLQASGRVNPDEVIDFYNKTMPALGWNRHAVDTNGEGKADPTAKRASYAREKEILFIEIKALTGGYAHMNVLLRPH